MSSTIILFASSRRNGNTGQLTDSVAKKRATTFYSLDGKALAPMFPPNISEESASLLPGSAKPALSLRFTWTPGHPVEDVRWVKTLIVCNRSFTYEEASSLQSIPELAALREVSRSLSADPYDWDDTHRWVESMMIFYKHQHQSLVKSRCKNANTSKRNHGIYLWWNNSVK